MNDRLLQKTRCNDKQVFLYLADSSSHHPTMMDIDECLCMLKILLQKKETLSSLIPYVKVPFSVNATTLNPFLLNESNTH